MMQGIQVLAAVLIGLSVAMGLAHVLELPGKLRLTEQQYRLVQPIYYPGFTIGGFVGEFGGIVVTTVLAAITPIRSSAFWPTVGALVALLAVHGTYWLVTHPVNGFWLADQPVSRTGNAFFRFGGSSRAHADWRGLRNQWEISHAIRMVFALVALSFLLVAWG